MCRLSTLYTIHIKKRKKKLYKFKLSNILLKLNIKTDILLLYFIPISFFLTKYNVS